MVAKLDTVVQQLIGLVRSEERHRGIEDSLMPYCEIDTISPHIPYNERVAYSNLVAKIAELADVYIKQNWLGGSLGMRCASSDSIPRSYMFTLLAANAVKEARKRKSLGTINIVELGAGSGLLSIAAALADPDVKVVAYEKDEYCVLFAQRMLKRFGLEDRVEIRHQNFLTADISGCYDVVINENICGALLKYESQLQAAQRILPYTHSGTVFVPAGIDIYFRLGNSEETYLGRIDFSRENPSPITFERPIEMLSNNGVNLQVRSNLLSYEGSRVFRDGVVDVFQLPLGGDYTVCIVSPVAVIHDGPCTFRLSISFPSKSKTRSADVTYTLDKIE